MTIEDAVLEAADFLEILKQKNIELPNHYTLTEEQWKKFNKTCPDVFDRLTEDPISYEPRLKAIVACELIEDMHPDDLTQVMLHEINHHYHIEQNIISQDMFEEKLDNQTFMLLEGDCMRVEGLYIYRNVKNDPWTLFSSGLDWRDSSAEKLFEALGEEYDDADILPTKGCIYLSKMRRLGGEPLVDYALSIPGMVKLPEPEVLLQDFNRK